MTNDRLLGLAEISEYYSVPKATASAWTRRPDFPEPFVRLSMGPVWRLDALLAWLRPNSGRPNRRNYDQRCIECGHEDSLWMDDGAWSNDRTGKIHLHCVFCHSRHVLTFHKGAIYLDRFPAEEPA